MENRKVKTAADKTTLNSMSEVLSEINTLVAQQEKEDYSRIFVKKSNLSLTYHSNVCLALINVSTTIQNESNYWIVDFNI
ncbi:hypothetical protein [Emticicia oligotrophica]|nr:hypothetical protein [Emticicia oligotrophica]